MLKNSILLGLLVCFMSCSKTDIKESVSTPDYMHHVFESNRNCSEPDFLNLKIRDQEFYFNYSDNYAEGLCSFKIGNSGGVNCDDCDRHHAKLKIPTDSFNTYFPDLPISIGMEWDSYYHGKHPVTDIKMSGLIIELNVTDKLIDNLKAGSYRARSALDFSEKGITMYFNWSVHHDLDGLLLSTGYGIELDKHQPHTIYIDCIDKSSPDHIKLTGRFSGIFVGKELGVNGNKIIYGVPVSGEFSYKITL